jgi:polyhydroxybutyrate depolymerase
MNKVKIFLLLISVCFGQLTLTHDGIIREYYISYPDSATEPCPLVINMHGFGSNAEEQQSYSEMDLYALDQNIAVVYPEGINNAWNVGAYWDVSNADDIGFISALIDSVAENFNIDLDRVYACGMSNGGYMAYELACELSDKIAAFGSVTGNFMINSDQSCNADRDIPFIHLHGTDDLIVPYTYSWDLSMYVGESINYWRNVNNLDYELIEVFPDSDPSDSTTVEKYTYYNSTTLTQFVHFKVIGGGHQWFGSSIADWDWIINSIGYSNHEINTNGELIDFFMNYKLSDFLSTEIITDQFPAEFILNQNYPNPFNPTTTISYTLPKRNFVRVSIFDMLGREVKTLMSDELLSGKHEIIWNGTNDVGQPVSAGVYFYSVTVGNEMQTGKMVLLK